MFLRRLDVAPLKAFMRLEGILRKSGNKDVYMARVNFQGYYLGLHFLSYLIDSSSEIRLDLTN